VSEPLTLIIPSRGRLESLRRCVNSALAYAQDEVEILIGFDSDYNCYKAYKFSNKSFGVPFDHRQYYVSTVNRLFNEILLWEDVNLFAICNNDQEFIVPNWDRIAKNKFSEHFPDHMGVMEIGNHPDMSYNTFISSVWFWQKYYHGILFNPAFKQYYADTERLMSLEQNGHFARLYPGLVHTHTMFDEVWHEGRQWMERDRKVWEEKL